MKFRHRETVKQKGTAPHIIIHVVMGIFILGAALALMSLLTPAREAEIELLKSAAQQDLNPDIWMPRLLKVSSLILFTCLFGLTSIYVSCLANDEVRKRLRAYWRSIPSWAKQISTIIVIALLYTTRGINGLPLVILFILYRAKVWERMETYWGRGPLRVAAALAGASLGAYVFIMLLFSVENANDVFWGDSARFVRDMTVVAADHYRTKTHPLYLLIGQTLYHLVAPAGGTCGPALRLLVAGAASLNVGLFCLFVSRISKSRAATVGCGIIFALSYPMIYQGAMMLDSFIFTQTTLLSCMLYFQQVYQSRKYSYWSLMSLSIAVAGMNLGYAVIFGIMYLVLLWKSSNSWGQAFRALMLFALGFFVCINVLMLLQYILYGEGANVPPTLIDALFNTAEEDAWYIRQDVTMLGFFSNHLPSYLVTALYWRPLPWVGESFAWWQLVWTLLLFVPIIKPRCIKQRALCIALALVNIFLVVFHAFYGGQELPIYGPIICLALISLLPFAFDIISKVRFGNMLVGTIISVIVVSEIITNAPGMVDVKRINNLYYPEGVSYTYEQMREIASYLTQIDDDLSVALDSLENANEGDPLKTLTGMHQ